VARVHQPEGSDTILVERAATAEEARQALSGYDERISYGPPPGADEPPPSADAPPPGMEVPPPGMDVPPPSVDASPPSEPPEGGGHG
jgi:hypothetical protein